MSEAECRFDKGLQVLDSNVSYILFSRNAHRLTFTTLWANSADDKLMIFFLFFFTRKQNLTVHRKLSGDNDLHEMSNPVSGKNKKK